MACTIKVKVKQSKDGEMSVTVNVWRFKAFTKREAHVAGVLYTHIMEKINGIAKTMGKKIV